MVYCFSDPTKFFGCELGAQTQIDLKNERYIVNGSHDGEKLQEILDDFIQKFVLCPECENPETVLVRFDKLRIFTRVLTLSPHRNIITNIKHLSNT
jgi:translation initiation factor 5